jgi:CelD/BcsL family acetyltransferase involved in cellulose biosynthesis
MDVPSTLPSSLTADRRPNFTAGRSSVKVTRGHSIEIITTQEGLSYLEKEWNRLSTAATFPNVFMTFDWFRTWNRHFAQKALGGRRRLNVLVLKRDGRVTGISPFIHRTATRFGLAVRKVEFIESQGDYNDLMLGDDPAGQIDAVLDSLARTDDQWDLVDLRDLRDTGNVVTLLKDALSRTRLLYRLLPEEESRPYLPIDAPWPTMLSRLSAHARHNFRNQQNRLKRMSAQGLRVRIIENPREEPGLMEKLIALETQKLVHGKIAMPFIGTHREVFQALFDSLGPRGWFCIALMELADRPLAWLMVFRCGNKLWGYQRAFDPSFSQISPGMLLDGVLLDYGFSRGYNEYDFLRGEETYKMRWTTGFHHAYRLLIWNRRWASRAKAFIYLDLKEATYRLSGKRRGPNREVGTQGK